MIHIELESTFEHRELPAKLLDYFLRSSKSNINQYRRLMKLPVDRHTDVWRSYKSIDIQTSREAQIR